MREGSSLFKRYRTTDIVWARTKITIKDYQKNYIGYQPRIDQKKLQRKNYEGNEWQRPEKTSESPRSVDHLHLYNEDVVQSHSVNL